MIIEIKCTINVVRLNRPQTNSHPQVLGKIIFHETGPWCPKDWVLLLEQIAHFALLVTFHSSGISGIVCMVPWGQSLVIQGNQFPSVSIDG